MASSKSSSTYEVGQRVLVPYSRKFLVGRIYLLHSRTNQPGKYNYSVRLEPNQSVSFTGLLCGGNLYPIDDNVTPEQIQALASILRTKEKNQDYPSWVCGVCAENAGGKLKGVATFHVDECGICGSTTSVTEPRDYGYPKF